MTTIVVLVTSLRDGQVTFFSSALTSLRKLPKRLYQRILSFMAFSLSGVRGRAQALGRPLNEAKWQVRQGSNPQPAVLETAALPIELLTCRPRYLTSLWGVCFRQWGQYLFVSSFS